MGDGSGGLRQWIRDDNGHVTLDLDLTVSVVVLVALGHGQLRTDRVSRYSHSLTYFRYLFLNADTAMVMMMVDD